MALRAATSKKRGCGALGFQDRDICIHISTDHMDLQGIVLCTQTVAMHVVSIGILLAYLQVLSVVASKSMKE